MLLSIIVFAVLALLLFIVNAKAQRKKHLEGLAAGWRQFIYVLPVILVAFLLAGFIEAAIPEEFVKQWLAREAGLRGIILGTLGGTLLAMGPYASFPIIASISAAGAGSGTVISLISAWSLLSLSKLPYEAGFLGMRFTIVRMSLSVPFCIAAGAVAHIIEPLF